MLPLAAAGFHVVAPDQRGYGRTTGWDGNYDGDLDSFRILNLMRDVLGLLSALGYRSVAGVIGHDFGSPVAAWCSLVRPDVFRSVALMSAPFAGPPQIPFDTDAQAPRAPPRPRPASTTSWRALDPPRKHYHWYYSTRAGRRRHAQGARRAACLPARLLPLQERGLEREQALSARGLGRRASLASCRPTTSWSSTRGWPRRVAPFMPTAAEIAACKWLTEEELAVYSEEYARTGFQGGLQWYRVRTSGLFDAEQEVFSGRTIDVPVDASSRARATGASTRRRARSSACSRAPARAGWALHLVDGAGHWVQQEQPEATTRLLLEFLRAAG